MAIAKIRRGNGFRGVLNYCLAREDWQGRERTIQPCLIGGNLAGRTPREMAAEFGVVRRIADQRVKNPVWHVSLSLPPGERLTPDQWQTFAREFIARMGDRARQGGEIGIDPNLNQWCLIHHPHTPTVTNSDTHTHDHVHLVLNRTNLEGKTAKLRNDHLDAQRVLRELEREFGLTPVPSSPALDPEQPRQRRQNRRSITREELAWAGRLTRKGEDLPEHLREKAETYHQARQARQHQSQQQHRQKRGGAVRL